MCQMNVHAMKCFALTNIVLNDFCLKHICNDTREKAKTCQHIKLDIRQDMFSFLECMILPLKSIVLNDYNFTENFYR